VGEGAWVDEALDRLAERDAKGLGAANDVGAFACKPAGLEQGDRSPPAVSQRAPTSPSPGTPRRTARPLKGKPAKEGTRHSPRTVPPHVPALRMRGRPY